MKLTKKQILLIHGGEAFESYEAYFEYLKKAEFNMESEKEKDKRWRYSLEKELGQGFEVIAPTMPNKQNSKYKEWKIWFEKILPYIDDNIILIGHSLGGIFLAKYLSENDFPKKILATYLIAAPYDDKEYKEKDGGYSLADFALPDSLRRLEKQGGRIYLYHSKDDPIVPFAEVKKYAETLPSTEKEIFEEKGHFMQEEFPELIDNIRQLFKN